jgi:hypothetical protein
MRNSISSQPKQRKQQRKLAATMTGKSEPVCFFANGFGSATDSDDSDASSSDGGDAMEGIERPKADPEDLSAYKLDDYDDERTKEARASIIELILSTPKRSHSIGRLWQYPRAAVPPRRSGRPVHHHEGGAPRFNAGHADL